MLFTNWNVGPFNLELTTNKNFVQRSRSVDPNLHGSENLLGYWISGSGILSQLLVTEMHYKWIFFPNASKIYQLKF